MWMKRRCSIDDGCSPKSIQLLSKLTHRADEVISKHSVFLNSQFWGSFSSWRLCTPRTGHLDPFEHGFKKILSKTGNELPVFWPQNATFWAHFWVKTPKNRIKRAFCNRQLVAGSKSLFFCMLCPQGWSRNKPCAAHWKVNNGASVNTWKILLCSRG